MSNQEQKIETELATFLEADGQTLRAFQNYFADTYEAIKGKKLDGGYLVINDRLEFYGYIKEALEFAIESTKAMKQSDPENYQEIN